MKELQNQPFNSLISISSISYFKLSFFFSCHIGITTFILHFLILYSGGQVLFLLLVMNFRFFKSLFKDSIIKPLFFSGLSYKASLLISVNYPVSSFFSVRDPVCFIFSIFLRVKQTYTKIQQRIPLLNFYISSCMMSLLQNRPRGVNDILLPNGLPLSY